LSVLLEPESLLAGRYQIKKVLGQGGMGAVYLATDSRIPEKTWAVKELWDYGDPSTRQLIQGQFQSEASILAALNHPNLPRITDFFVENHREYLVMDFIEGRTLEEILLEEKGPLKMDMVMDIIGQLAGVLEYLHGQDPPVIFRDLKPSNVMVTPSGRLCLIDFGIARVFSAGKKKDTVVMGTPGYAAPEQYGSGQSDARSDIYGLGATIYYCITGVDPSDNPFHFEAPSRLNGKVFPRLERAVQKAVQLEASQRFASVAEMRDYLFGPGSSTSDISPMPEAVPSTGPATRPLAPFVLEPQELDFGITRKGETRKRKFVIRGRSSRLSLQNDRPWIRVYPALVDGLDQDVGVTVYTSSLNHGGKYQGTVILKGEKGEAKLPVKVEIEPRHLNFLAYLLIFIFTMISLVPGLGIAGFLYNLVAYFSLPAGERKSIKIFFYVTLFATLLWAVVGALYFGISRLGWFRGWIF
jgi:serine/threonine protein kinase